MLSRALSLATVTLLIGCLTAGAARAVENLDAGKSPSQIFSNTCSACHKSPRGLLKNTSPSSLPGFLRQHYTTGSRHGLGALFLSDIQRGCRPPVSGQGSAEAEGRQAGRKAGSARPARSPAAARRSLRRRLPGRTPTAQPQGEGARPGRDAKRLARPQRRPTPPNLRMDRPRCRPRPTANQASGRSRADVASPPPKNRRKPSRQPPAMPRRKMRRGMPPRLKPPRPILPRPILPRPMLTKTDAIKPSEGATSRPARQRSP